jgi:GT2 family glycosyltransferase
MIIKYVGEVGYSRGAALTSCILDTICREYKAQLSPTNSTEVYDPKIARLIGTVVPYNTVIHHVAPSKIVVEEGKLNVGVVECKTTEVPSSWVSPLTRLDHIITTSEFTKAALRSIVTGVTVITPPILPSTDTIDLPPQVHGTKYLLLPEYYSSNWVTAVTTFLYTFTSEDDVTLLVCTGSEVVRLAVHNLVSSVPNPPTISLLSTYDPALLPVDYLYNPYYGSGIDCYMLRLLLGGTAAISTKYGAPMEYLPDTKLLLPYTLYPATSTTKEPDYDESLAWARPTDISEVLRESYTNRITAVPPKYSYEGAMSGILDLLADLDTSQVHRDAPPVTIVVLSYNNYPMLVKCVESLRRNTPNPLYELLILDNGSDPNDTTLFNYLKSLDCRVIYSDTNHGFAGGNNIAADTARGEVLVFLNNDTEVQPNWLEPILDLLDHDTVGVVGSRLIYPNWTIQHAGVAFNPGATSNIAYHPYSGHSHDYPPANIRREVHSVTGACLSISRSLFTLLGGFDTSYIRGYYEDADLCTKARDAGYQVVYEPASLVVHKHGQSFSKLGNLGEQDFFQHNEAQFLSRHSKKVVGSGRLFDSKHSYGKPNIGILNSYIYTMGGGEKVTTCIAKALEDTNNVDVLVRSNKPVTRRMVKDKLGIELRTTEFVGLLDSEDPKYYRDYDIFLNCQWGSSDPGIGRRNIYSCMFPHTKTWEPWLDTYDSIWANSEYTACYIKKYWGREATVMYPPVTPMATPGEIDNLTKSKKNVILSVGRFFKSGHCKNQKVMIEAFKQLNIDNWELHLVGTHNDTYEDTKYYEECLKLAEGYNVRFSPNPTFNDIRESYREAKVYWHAAGYGATDPSCMEHFGISPVEAMSAGCYPMLYRGGGLVELCPLVPTWTSSEGLCDMTLEYIGSTTDMGVLMERAAVFSQDRFEDNVKEVLISG